LEIRAVTDDSISKPHVPSSYNAIVHRKAHRGASSIFWKAPQQRLCVLLVANLDCVTTVDGDSLAVKVLAAHDEEDSSSHVLILSRALSGKTLLVVLGHLRLLVVVSTLLSGHL
jgi:hypothetical protein